jgi:hypothetical protein
MTNIENKVFNSYLEIKQDLINNLNDLWNRQNYYTHKYKGTRWSEKFIGLSETSEGNKELLIFVRFKDIWIRDELIYNGRGIVNSKITSNLGYDE